MSASLQYIKAVPCTYVDCDASFDTAKQMRAHKKNSEFHDYCEKCDEDFDSYDDLALHKAQRPDKHGKACRICGDEFKSTAGLKRHIELSHRVDQKLSCLGCGEQFYRASLLIEHLEFGHCSQISAVEFQGHIVHKYLIAELLKGGPNFHRFMQKISKYDAANDQEDEGGINLLDDDPGLAQNIEYPSIEPEVNNTPTPLSLEAPGSFPALPSKGKSKASASGHSGPELVPGLESMSLSGETRLVTLSSTVGIDSQTSSYTPKAWGSGRTASALFPHAKPTPAPSEWSVEQHDRDMEKSEGINILNTRFWDPTSGDWNPERFYDSVLNKYYCPFICEQNYDIPADLNRHIMDEHRISKMKCPYCLKHYKSATALVAHCESRGSRCQINKADDFGTFLDRLTGGFLGVEEKVRPDHLYNPTVVVANPETGRLEKYRPPTATYLQYSVTKPVDWKEREDKQPKVAYQIGGGHDRYLQ